MTSFFDIQSIPKRYFFELLSHFTTDPLEKEKFIEFNTAEGLLDVNQIHIALFIIDWSACESSMNVFYRKRYNSTTFVSFLTFLYCFCTVWNLLENTLTQHDFFYYKGNRTCTTTVIDQEDISLK